VISVLLLVLATIPAAIAAYRAAQRSALRSGRASNDERARLLVETVGDALKVVGNEAASDAVVARLGRALGGDAAAVGLAEGDDLVLFGMWNYWPGTRGRRLRPGEGLAGRVWATGQAIVVRDLADEPTYQESPDALRSGVYVPGSVNSRVVVVLAVESRRVGAFDEDDLRLVQPVADLFAAMLDSRHRLREAQQLSEQLLTSMGHELRTPLTGVLSSLSTLEQHADSLDSATYRDVVSRGLRAGGRLSRLVGRLSLAARLDAGAVPLQPGRTELGPLVAQALSVLGPQARVALSVPAGLSAHADREQLATAMTALIEAVAGPAGRLAVSAAANSGNVVVTIRSDGATLAPHLVDAASGHFVRGAQTFREDSGLSLWLARRLVAEMHGELRLSSAPDRGTTARVRLPAA